MWTTNRKNHRGLLAILILVVAAPPLATFAAPQSAPTNETIVLKDVRVIDGSGAPPMEHAAIVIEGSRIVSVGPLGKLKWPKSARVIDYAGKTVLPGLISDHSHVGQIDGTTAGPQNYNRANILRQLHQYEAYGVTSITALGLNADLFYELRPELHSGTLPGADLFGADHGIGVPDGAPPFALPQNQIYRAATPEDAIRAVGDMATRKPDLIKLWVDDFHGTLRVKMSPEIYGAAIKEAHKLGLRIAAHVYYLADAKLLVNDGVDILAHGVRDVPVDDELIRAMKAHSTWYIPTIGLDESFYIFAEQPDRLNDPFLAHALQPALAAQFNDPAWRAKALSNQAQSAANKASVAMNKRNVKALHDAGVNIGFGTDSGATPLRIPGFAEHHELELLVDAGLTPLQAINLATAKAAALLHLDDRGVIATGKLADLIVVDGNPATQIRDTQKIVAVYHRGEQASGPIHDFVP
jgi:imidazolonepropionase-like amidohydrolase